MGNSMESSLSPLSEVVEGNEITWNILETLSLEVQSSLLKRDIELYVSAMEDNIREEFVKIDNEDLNIKVKESILEMDEWLFSAGVSDYVWQIVLKQTEEWFVLTGISPDRFSSPNSLTFMDIDGEEKIIVLGEDWYPPN